jgi:hypothetical protein
MEIGIQQASGDTYIQEVSIKRAPGFNVKRKLADGTPGPGAVGDYRHEIEIRRLGTSSEVIGGELALALDAISGGATHVTKIAHAQKFGDYDEETLSAVHYPAATRGGGS